MRTIVCSVLLLVGCVILTTTRTAQGVRIGGAFIMVGIGLAVYYEV